MKLSSMANTRCRIRRVSDSKLFGGWVAAASDTAICLRIGSGLSVGDECTFEVHGLDRTAIFEAELIVQKGHDAYFKIASTIRYRQASEGVRFAVSKCPGRVWIGGEAVAIEGVDVSRQGFAMHSAVAVEQGQLIDTEIESSVGPVMCKGEVRYCRVDDENPEIYRIGVLVQETMGRLDAARWRKLFISAA
jgi:hypothetical protein